MNLARRIALVLLALGFLTSFASLFGPSQLVAGVDVGAAGTVLFVLVVACSVWLFAKRGDEVFPEHMSVAERRAWVGLAFACIVVASFARHFWAMAAQDFPPETFRDPIGRHFIQQLLALMIGWTVIARLISRQAGGIEVDERDLRLLDRAHAAGDFALTLIVIGCIVVLAFTPVKLIEWWLAPMALVYVLVGVLIAKSLVEQVALALAYRSKQG